MDTQIHKSLTKLCTACGYEKETKEFRKGHKRVEDVIVPTYCPVFGTELTTGIGKLHANSPTLNKIIPRDGYVKGNVAVISFRANAIKQNASSEELFKLANWLKQQENNQ